MKKSKSSETLSAVVLIAAGVLMILFAGEGLAVVLRLLGAGLLILGGIGVASYYRGKNQDKSVWKMLLAAVEAVAGLILLVSPKLVLSVYPIIVGLIVIAHGLWDLLNALNGKRRNEVSWKPLFIFSVITILLGVVILCRPFATADLLTTLIGIVLAYDGITTLLTAKKK